MSNSLPPMVYTVHGILQARILEWVAVPFSKGPSHPGIKPRSPTLQADSLPAGPPGKPENTGVGNLSLLQQIFLTQKSTWGLLRCRWILCQLSSCVGLSSDHQGSLCILCTPCFISGGLSMNFSCLNPPELSPPSSQLRELSEYYLGFLSPHLSLKLFQGCRLR